MWYVIEKKELKRKLINCLILHIVGNIYDNFRKNLTIIFKLIKKDYFFTDYRTSNIYNSTLKNQNQT